MQITKLLLAAVLPVALFGCPEKSAETKPDPAVAAKDAGVMPAPIVAAPAASAKAGGGW